MKDKRVRCGDSGMFTGMAPGHLDKCLGCGRMVPTTVDSRLAEHKRKPNDDDQ